MVQTRASEQTRKRIENLISGVNGKTERTDLVKVATQLIVEEVCGGPPVAARRTLRSCRPLRRFGVREPAPTITATSLMTVGVARKITAYGKGLMEDADG